VSAADALITRDGPVAVPMDYTVPATASILPVTVTATFDGSAAGGSFLPTLEVLSPNGDVIVRCPITPAIAAGASAAASWFPGAELEEQATVIPGAAVESFFFDSITDPSTPVYSATTLPASVLYTVTIQGTYTEWNQALTVGTPNANALYPGSTAGRVSTEVGIDPECCFASPTPVGPPGPFTPGQHTDNLELSLGAGFAHLEPIGGPFSTPQSGYAYTYRLTGQGSPLGVRNKYLPTTDNYGKLLVTIQGGTGGGGSLTPPTNAGNNGQVLLTAAGIAAWGNVDGGAP